jgi:hypothetical protein
LPHFVNGHFSFRLAVLAPNIDADGDDVMDEDIGAGEEKAARWLSKAFIDGNGQTQQSE